MVLMHRSTSTYVLNVRFVLGWGITFFFINLIMAVLGLVICTLGWNYCFRTSCMLGNVVLQAWLFTWNCCSDWLHAWNCCSRIGYMLGIAVLGLVAFQKLFIYFRICFTVCQELLFQDLFYARNRCSRNGSMQGNVVLGLVVYM